MRLGPPLLALALAACGPPPTMMPTGAPLGATCAADADCASAHCLDAAGVRLCTQPCAADADCAGATGGLRLACGVGPDGTPECVPPCGMLRYTCVAGVPTACEQVTDDTHCIDCRCADATTHCVRDVGCLPPAAVGEPCRSNTDCASRDCSTFAGVCRVPVGAACSASNCDECLTLPGGATHCARACMSPAECNGDACVGDTTLMVTDCRPSSCGGGACMLATGTHDVGQSCHADVDCRSGQCFASPRCVGTDCVGEGWCSAPCTAESDCAAGTHCVMLPCAAGQTTGCGTQCLHACAGFTDCGVYGGVCAGLEDTTRTVQMVCDVRHPTGGACADGADCLSAHCTSGSCAP